MKNVADKFERWSLRLSGFIYEVVHISGEDNVWADFLSLWRSPNKPNTIQGSIQSLFKAPHAPYLDANFHSPTISDLLKANNSSIEKYDEAIYFPNSSWGLY